MVVSVRDSRYQSGRQGGREKVTACQPKPFAKSIQAAGPLFCFYSMDPSTCRHQRSQRSERAVPAVVQYPAWLCPQVMILEALRCAAGLLLCRQRNLLGQLMQHAHETKKNPCLPHVFGIVLGAKVARSSGLWAIAPLRFAMGAGHQLMSIGSSPSELRLRIDLLAEHRPRNGLLPCRAKK